MIGSSWNLQKKSCWFYTFNGEQWQAISNKPIRTVQQIDSIMQKEAMGNDTPLRHKTHSLRQTPNRLQHSPSPCNHIEFAALSSSLDVPRHRGNSVEGVLDYLREVVEQLYCEDAIGIVATLKEFLQAKGTQLRGKLQERLSLLRYLEGSLRFRSFTEIEAEVFKEWRKNALFFSTSTIWARCMLTHEFKNQSEFAREYQRFRTLIANMTHFYFKNSLKVLANKGVDTLTLLFDDTAHQVIAGLNDWKEIYFNVLLPLVETRQRHSPEDQQGEKTWKFDLNKLRVNPHYLDPSAEKNQLPLTSQLITELANEYRLHHKVALLKRIRACFLTQIGESSRILQAKQGNQNIPSFQKDDIIDCMIYCIIKGRITCLQDSLNTLALLLGKDSQLLSKRGVDSYRADLQAAVQYLQQQHSMSTEQNSLHH